MVWDTGKTVSLKNQQTFSRFKIFFCFALQVSPWGSLSDRYDSSVCAHIKRCLQLQKKLNLPSNCPPLLRVFLAANVHRGAHACAEMQPVQADIDIQHAGFWAD